MEEKKLAGQLAEKEIEALKAQHGEIYFAKTETNIAYFRKPKRQELGYALAVGKNDQLAVAETLLKSCFVAGDRVFIEDIEYTLGAMPIVEKLMQVKTVELGNC